MKKNTMMKIASVLLIAVLLTTCVISGTFAKYTNNTTSNDSARVAKWGWNSATISIDDLFAASYDAVKAGSEDKGIIAPGTTDSTTITLFADEAFAPEVAYALTFDVVEAIDADLEALVDWTLTINSQAQTLEHKSLADVAAAIEALSGNKAADAPTSYTIVIGWTWAFDGADAADTALGDKAANSAEDLLVSLDITVTATQLDETPAP